MDQLLGGVKLVADYGQHIHPRKRSYLQQDRNVVAVDLDADRIFQADRVGLVRSFLQHGGKAEELNLRGLVHHYFLAILVHPARN